MKKVDYRFLFCKEKDNPLRLCIGVKKKEGWVMPTPSKTTGYQESDEQAAAWSTRITSGTASITHQ